MTPFDYLATGKLEIIQQIPMVINQNNVNDQKDKLNIFEALCSLVALQQGPVKESLAEVTAKALQKMFDIQETDWNKKDANGNTVFEWAVWSASSKVMDTLWNNKEIMTKFIEAEKGQIHNLFRVIIEPHIPQDFREIQIEKFKEAGLNIDLNPFNYLATGKLEAIQQIPKVINQNNVNDQKDKLNIFEALCSLVALQQGPVKESLAEVTAKTLQKMFDIQETDWNKKDANGNTVLEWAVWSTSSTVMEALHTNNEIMTKFIEAEKGQIHNFWRVVMETHIPQDFREIQIEKFEKAGLKINDFANDHHTPIYNALNILLNTYIAKYTNIEGQNDQLLNTYQNQINKYEKIVENYIKYGADLVIEGANIRLLLVKNVMQISNIIDQLTDPGKHYIAKTGFAKLIKQASELNNKTFSDDAKSTNIDNNTIAVLGNQIYSIKQKILKSDDPKQKKLLTDSFKELKLFAEPVIKDIVKQKGFNPDIKDTDVLGSNTIAWLGEFGAPFLRECIQNMQQKPDLTLKDNQSLTSLHWYADYNAEQVVQVLIENGGNVNIQEENFASTPVHRLFLNSSGINPAKPKLATLEILLNKQNKPPYDPNLKMVGNKTVMDLITEKDTPDSQACGNVLKEYTDWYTQEQVQAAGEGVENLDFYA